eukprot:726552-Pleurochrysis_carterae.AAC.1
MGKKRSSPVSLLAARTSPIQRRRLSHEAGTSVANWHKQSSERIGAIGSNPHGHGLRAARGMHSCKKCTRLRERDQCDTWPHFGKDG